MKQFYLIETNERFVADMPGEPQEGNIVYFDGDLPYKSSENRAWRVYRVLHTTRGREAWLEPSSDFIRTALKKRGIA